MLALRRRRQAHGSDDDYEDSQDGGQQSSKPQQHRKWTHCLSRVVYVIDIAKFFVASMRDLVHFSSVATSWRHAVLDFGRATMWRHLRDKLTKMMLARILLSPQPEHALEFLLRWVQRAGISLSCDTYEHQLPAMLVGRREDPASNTAPPPFSMLFVAVFFGNTVVADGLVVHANARMFEFELSAQAANGSVAFYESFVPYASRVVWKQEHAQAFIGAPAATANNGGPMTMMMMMGQPHTMHLYSRRLGASLLACLERRSLGMARIALKWTSDECLAWCAETRQAGQGTGTLQPEPPLLITALDGVRAIADLDVIETLLVRGVPVVADTARSMRTPADIAKSNPVCADALLALLAKYEAASETE